MSNTGFRAPVAVIKASIQSLAELHGAGGLEEVTV
jgi:hypothetical protein